ncbi:MAG: adenosylcobinamide-phosphate synthase CbiB [Sneathiellales bacterium]|nr:adenosylcobinamide-phosphate synthase CbiB [Sneathiellales bacterium]
MIIDASIGWPKRLFRILSHPVVWIGWIISALERNLNRPEYSNSKRKLLGFFTTLILCSITLVIAGLLFYFFSLLPLSFLLFALATWPMLAIRSLYDHIHQIEVPLRSGDIKQARKFVGYIVSRDPKEMDEAAIARASLESLSENTSDGVIAPLFWATLLGLPGLYLYKAVNTLDSMIGYKNEKYRYFGWASARLDDFLNLIPARLTALFMAIVSAAFFKTMTTTLMDAGKHRSPNAGWPEAAMASALDIRLSGPRSYEGEMTNDPWVNEGAPDPDRNSFSKALHLYKKTIWLSGILLVFLLVLLQFGTV